MSSDNGYGWHDSETTYDGNSESFELLVDPEYIHVLIHTKTGRPSHQRLFNNTQEYSMWFDSGR